MGTLLTENSFLLTINQITKLCTDRILLEPSGQVSDNQWHRFQLVEVANLLGIESTDKITGQLRSRVDLGRKITHQLKVSSDALQTAPTSQLVKYGLMAQKTTQAHTSNIGGTPNLPLQIDETGIDVIFTPENFYTATPSGVREASKPTTPSVMTSNLSPAIPTVTPPRHGTTTPPVAIQIPKSKSKSKSKANQQIQDKIAGRIQRQDICVSGGPLWFDNKCYLDSLIMVLLQPSPDNQYLPLILNQFTQISEQNPDSVEGAVATEIIRLKQEFSNYQINTLAPLTQLLDQVPYLSLAGRYTTNQPQDTRETLLNILELATLDYRSSNIHQEWYAVSLDEDIPSEGITSFASEADSLPSVSDLYHEQEETVYWTYQGNGTSPCLLVHTIQLASLSLSTDHPTEIQDLLVIQVDSELPDSFVQTYHGWSFTEADRSFRYTDSEGEKYQIPPDQTHLEDEVYYYFGDEPIVTSDNTIVIGEQLGTTKYSRHIIRHTVNHADFLVVTLTRETGVGATIITTPIIPNQHLTVGEQTLDLQAIICYVGNVSNGHYYSYYQCNQQWYQYNDLGCEITNIGGYDQLLQREDITEHSCVLFYQPENK